MSKEYRISYKNIQDPDSLIDIDIRFTVLPDKADRDDLQDAIGVIAKIADMYMYRSASEVEMKANE